MESKKLTFFEKNPELYEQGFSYRKINQQVNFLDRIFKKNKCKKILDIACGHSPQGRLLAKKGYQVSGIDISRPLLRLGKQRASQEKADIRFYKRDMSNFYLDKFDAAYILFSSILHLYKKEDLISHFKSVNKNLKKNGVYVIDLSSLPFDNPLKSKEIRYTKGKLKTIINYSPKDIFNLTSTFEIKNLFNKGTINKKKFTTLMFLPLPFLFSLANANGLKIEELYADFDFSKKLNRRKPEYIAILRKR